MIARALLSVSDKAGLVPLARALAARGVEILSTGGTAKHLREHDVFVVEISAYTGFPEILSGRVKTLHPTVHGGLLYRRGDATHEDEVTRAGIQPIDLLVVNLYPFEQTVNREGGATLAEAIEQIDIGGPAMLRSAAKNYRSVTVVTDPSDYSALLAELEANGGATTEALRARLAVKVFAATSRYDGAIASWLGQNMGDGGGDRPDARPVDQPMPSVAAPAASISATAAAPASPATPSPAPLSHPFLDPALPQTPLRYGENPHQRAALIAPNFGEWFQQLHGQELSYNNLLDLAAAAELIGEFCDAPACAILKHNNPCGVGTDDTSLRAAWDKAFATDRQAPFGGIIAVNQPLDEDTANAIAEIFSEVIVAPDFTAGALAILQKKKKLRLLRQLRPATADLTPELRSIPGGLLVQERNRELAAEERCVTRRVPSDTELRALHFGWRVVRHVKSNAIVFCGRDRTLGVGAGQMARVDSVKLAVWKAREAELSLHQSVVASDAFFPFADGLLAALDAGATAAIQPGGSVRDGEVVAAADARDAAMVFTGRRHFRH